MITENEFKELENSSLENRIERVEKLLAEKENPKPFELGMFLALKMGEEISKGIELGSTSGKIVAEWNSKYPESIVEEAIASAKEFLINPTKLAAKIKSEMLKKIAEKENPKSENNSEKSSEA